MDDFSVIDLFFQASVIVQLVMILLLAVSIISWIVIFERYFNLNRIKEANKAFETVDSRSSAELAVMHADKPVKIFDVRKSGEYAASHVEGATHTPLSSINEYLEDYNQPEDLFVHCKGGYRSVIAISILKSRGIHNLINVTEGYDQIEKENFRITKTCQN